MAASSGSDSDFYGHAEEVARLQERVRLAGHIFRRTEAFHAPTERGRAQAFNAFAGVSYAWQLGESTEDFIVRLPPATTVADAHTPWIYVCNSHVKRRMKSTAGNQTIAGCEDEGPEAEGTQTQLFVLGGKERLDLLRDFLHASIQTGLRQRATAAEIDGARRAAVCDILDLAGHLGVTCGKWMLFVSPETVNETWKTVVRGTVRNELGIAAKVAPQDPAIDPQAQATRPRLICIYTTDFRDRLDVERVLQRIAALGLVPNHAGPIHYKCDAFTYLGIGSINPWGLRASLYSSRTFFGG